MDYDINDPAFKEMLECLILGSKAYFSYQPSGDECKQFIAKNKGLKVHDLARYEITEAEKEEAKKALIIVEQDLPLEKRVTVGDASETGIIKFC